MTGTRKRVAIPIWKTVLLCAAFLMLGAFAGAGSKLADVYSELLGGITSAMGVWIFICVTICAFTKSPFRAAAYVLLFCAGMVSAYYLIAELGGLYYSRQYVKLWSIFTLFTPVFAYFAWFARGRGRLPWVLRTGIAVVTVLCCFCVIPGYPVVEALFAAGAFAVTMTKVKENKNGDGS